MLWRFAGKRKLLPLVALLTAAVFITSCVLYIKNWHDPRFYSRVSLSVPHDPAWLASSLPKPSPPKSKGKGAAGPIPRTIWQIFLTPPGVDEAAPEVPAIQRDFIQSWRIRNRDYEYHLLRDNDTAAFVRDNFAHHDELQRLFVDGGGKGGSAAMKSDLLRYLVLFARGGVYTDLDTVAWQPIDDWVPAGTLRERARLVIGVEFDRLEGDNWKGVHHDLQFCQWTIAAAPGHPVFSAMVARALRLIRELEAAHGTPFHRLRPSNNDVLTTTGPAAWTDAVFQELRRIDPTLGSLRDLSGLREEKLIGDILILPIDGFGAGQRHSGSTRLGVPAAARAKHKFHGVWKGKESRI